MAQTGNQTRAALKTLRRMTVDAAKRIIAKIQNYASYPASQANNVMALKGRKGIHLGVGDWRVPEKRYRAAANQALSSLDRKPGRRHGRTIKEATVKSFHYASIGELRRHVRDWLTAYNFAKQLKALKLRTPDEAVEDLWKTKPDAFIVIPNHHMLGLNT